MFVKRNIDRMEAHFLCQFEQLGNEVVYRKHGRGVAVPVSEAEKDGFKKEYRRASIRLVWGGVAFVFLAVVIGDLSVPGLMDDGLGPMIIAAVAGAGIAFLGLRNYSAPARALAGRSPVGKALGKDAYQARHFSAIGWPVLGAIFVASTAVCLHAVTAWEFREIPDYLWTIGSGAMAILGARALWLKYRYASQHR